MSKKSFEKFTDEKIEEIVNRSKTFYECLREMNIPTHGCNLLFLKKKISALNVDISHFYLNTVGVKAAGQYSRKRTSNVNFDDLKRNKNRLLRIIKEQGRFCENCKRTSWFGEEIPLEIHHIDGDNKNNKRDNIACLCPNCHALTENWRGRKNKNSQSHKK